MRDRLIAVFAIALVAPGWAVIAAPPVIQSDRTNAAPADAGDYLLDVGDTLRVTVFNEPTLSGDFSVSASGSLALPLIGEVTARGKRPQEVAQAIQAALANGYLRNPQVSTEVTEYRPFFLLGEVKAPGKLPYAVGLTVMNAIAESQGFTPRADRKSVYIRGQGETTEQRLKLTPELRVLPGDTIRVGERYF